MPPENDFPILEDSAPDRVRRTVGRGSNMLAYKPRGERGPTVYRDTTDIPPEHMARLNGASARFAPRESAQVERSALDAPLASDVPQPDASAESMRASQLSMPQLAGSIALVQAALVALQQELQRRAAALRVSRRRPDVTFLGEVLPGIMEPCGDGVVFGDESNPMPILADAEELRKYFEDLKKRGEEDKARMEEEAARLRNRKKPEAANGLDIERPAGSSDDLFPWKLVDPPPQPLSGSPDADDMPPTYSPVPPSTGFDLLEDERKQREAIRKWLEAKGTFDGTQPWQPHFELPPIVYQDPPRDWVEALKRHLEQPPRLYRDGTGTLGPFYLPRFELPPIGLWGGGSLSGKGVAGGVFIGPIPFLGPSSVRLYFGPSAELGGAFPGLGGEFGISIHIR